jgi:hypothetical protein
MKRTIALLLLVATTACLSQPSARGLLCQHDSDCRPRDEACYLVDGGDFGICGLASGESCKSDKNCPNGEVCYDGGSHKYCVDRSVVDPTQEQLEDLLGENPGGIDPHEESESESPDCLPGLNQCEFGEKCVKIDLTFKCVEDDYSNQLGESCSSDEECEEGRVCGSGTATCGNDGSCCVPVCSLNESEECSILYDNGYHEGECRSLWNGRPVHASLEEFGFCRAEGYRGCNPFDPNCDEGYSCQLDWANDVEFRCVEFVTDGLGELGESCSDNHCQDGLLCGDFYESKCGNPCSIDNGDDECDWIEDMKGTCVEFGDASESRPPELRYIGVCEYLPQDDSDGRHAGLRPPFHR